MAPAAQTAGAADSKIAYMGQTEFVYDGDLPDLTGPAKSWYFAPGQQPDLDRVAKLAAAFGIEGEVRTLPADQGGGWAVGPEDYSGPVLSVGSDGMLSWWLSAAPSAVSSAGCAVVEATPPDAGSGAAGSGTATNVVVSTSPPDTPTTKLVPVPDCAAPQPPAGVPTKEEALAKAKELFASWGYDLTSYTFDDPYADEWSASVTAWLTLDGMKAPITLSVGFGENGTVTWASGSLATPQPGGDYPTVGAAAGLERLKAQQNQYLAMTDTGVARGAADQVVPDTAAPVDSANASTGVVAPGVVTPEPAAMPTETAPAAPGVGVREPAIAPICATDVASDVPADCGRPIPVDPVTVTLNSVKNDLTMVWAEDQTIWLLPAYTFGSADGGTYTVIAVADEFIQQPTAEPATTEPVIEPAGPPVTGVPVPATAVVDAPPTT